MSYESTLLERLHLEKQRAQTMERQIDALTDRIQEIREDLALSREENADLRSRLIQDGITAIRRSDDFRVQVAGTEGRRLRARLDTAPQTINIQYLSETNGGRYRMPTYRGLQGA